MVRAPSNKLKEFCSEIFLDAPKKINSLFSGTAATVLLNNLIDFRDSLVELNCCKNRMNHHRVLPLKVIAVLYSISFFCIIRIIRMYLKACEEFLGDILDV
ncbi:cdf11054-0cdb-4ff6-8316-26a4994ccc19-CDS [Sclerotinia trifoliorum]|uniref:Cdf11054-0cdb-4ff6-8316-26a4994ccc19-CDS n=1 Tax=Sclerotinia trifoliorum TaxID=28548 RepID=A0A8H2W4L6_9HELO|nr:cdf11054-0cdb-4ff6-8316-26a4994ccc19-CDS [Sclerotinia trifoliorum]